MTYTLIIILITAVISYSAFTKPDVMDKLLLWPKRMDQNKEYYRFVTNGLVHLDMQHLLFNMLTLYFFGSNVELITNMVGGRFLFLFFYVSAIIIASLPSYFKHRHHGYYRSLGASGGVSAVLFAAIYYNPWALINFIIPSIIFAIGYLVYTIYMSKKSGDQVNHDAHLWGAVYGFVFAFIIDPSHGQFFLHQLTHPPFFN